MPVKLLDVPGIGPVSFHKSRRSRHIRIGVRRGAVHVSLPQWTPYAVAKAFASQQSSWIVAELEKQSKPILKHGDKIGKLHTLHFEQTAEKTQVRTRVSATKLIIQHYPHESSAAPTVQERAEKAAIRALKKEAGLVLPPRLHELAAKHGCSVRTVTIKNLTRRWGSCDTHGNIALSLFLMQLSWQQIDYVICHELAHTKHMNHGGAFWTEVERMLPDARMIAKRVRHIQPALTPTVQKNATAFDDDVAY
ncbi:hypothetical protein CSA80_01245 [Candidatus Saccharibacteria bacterium]|nr:MAG: hypothetical protein CR973_01910 [Candidatus Saccharibacteria bacterium]PID99370.1 MAG: hypothetical protein CSA80_01245 [Candidatus Saccharibacteria bacterium]